MQDVKITSHLLKIIKNGDYLKDFTRPIRKIHINDGTFYINKTTNKIFRLYDTKQTLINYTKDIVIVDTVIETDADMGDHPKLEFKTIELKYSDILPYLKRNNVI